MFRLYDVGGFDDGNDFGSNPNFFALGGGFASRNGGTTDDDGFHSFLLCVVQNYPIDVQENHVNGYTLKYPYPLLTRSCRTNGIFVLITYTPLSLTRYDHGMSCSCRMFSTASLSLIVFSVWQLLRLERVVSLIAGLLLSLGSDWHIPVVVRFVCRIGFSSLLLEGRGN